MAENEIEGTILKNVVQLEVIGAKDYLSMVEAALSKTSFWEEENSGNTENATLLIQLEVYLVL